MPVGLCGFQRQAEPFPYSTQDSTLQPAFWLFAALLQTWTSSALTKTAISAVPTPTSTARSQGSADKTLTMPRVILSQGTLRQPAP